MMPPLSLTALADAQAALLAPLTPVAPRRVPCAQAVGLIAAEEVRVMAPQPTRGVALRAGYALRSEDLAGASAFAPAFLARAPKAVALGDALPEGCDCVLDAAALDLSGPMPQAFVESWPGENVRRAGEDLAGGALLIEAGARIEARDALVAALAGVAGVSVRQPRVSMPGANDEIATFIAHLVRATGASVADDDPDLIVAMGEAPADAALFGRGLALEPGRDVSPGWLGAAPLVVLPRHPAQALAGFHALVRPALDVLAARAAAALVCLPLVAKIASRVGVAELVLLRAHDGAFTPLAVGDCPLRALSHATHIALMPAQSEGHAAGDLFCAEMLDL